MSRKHFLLPFLAALIVALPFISLVLIETDVLVSNFSIGLLGYCGAVLGGLLTLVGVRWTIEDARKQQRADWAMQYRPLLSPSIADEGKPGKPLPVEANLLLQSTLFNNNRRIYLANRVSLINVGRGEIINFSISNSACEFINPSSTALGVTKMPVVQTLFDSQSRLVVPGDSIDIIASVPSLAEGADVSIFGLNLRIRCCLTLEIEGVLSDALQTYRLEFYIDGCLRPYELDPLECESPAKDFEISQLSLEAQ